MRSSVILCLVFFSFSVFSQANRRLPNGQINYYGEQFYKVKVTKELLYNILNSNHNIVSNRPDTITGTCEGQCYRHGSVGYEGARKIMFGELFIQQDAKGNFVQDVYCDKKFYFRSVNEIPNMHSEVNIEHTWPQSKFSGSFDKNMQKSDMHHLYPTDSQANNRRANHEFGDVSDRFDELNVQNCSISKLSDISGHFIFTPPVKHRGNVARSLFYFATRYKMSIGQAEELILREWHKRDPVDEGEIARHEIIAKYQKVRNPFVDYPELVDRIGDF